MDRRFPIEEFEADRFREFFGNETERLVATLFTGGACNSNYLVETSKNKKFVCRIHRRGDPKTEKRITESLPSDIPVPRCLWESKGLSVIEYIEGDHFTPSEKLVREAGRIIGRLSQISFERFGQITPAGDVISLEGWESHQSGLSSLCRSPEAKRYLSDDAVSTLRNLLKQHSSELESFDDSHNLVHGDFNPDNILISGDRIVGIIDWEFSHSGSSYVDIGNLLRHIPETWEEHLALGLKEEGFNLPDDWRHRSLLIDLASHLEFLTSGRSEDFKKRCVGRIHQFIELSTRQASAEKGQHRAML